MYRWLRRLAAVLLAWSLVVSGPVWGEDVAILSSSGNRRARSRVSGEVVEYTGRQIVVRTTDGREIKRPGRQVVEIETEWPIGKEEGDRLFEAQQFQAAREKYGAAARKETRPWARRAIMARIIACYRELDQFESAGKLFLAIVNEDAESPYFNEIPLAWFNAQLSPSLEQAAGKWLAESNPVAQLLGASHLLATNEREKAFERLTQLAKEKDHRIADLAEAQTWRTMVSTADEGKMATWEQRVERFPDDLRAGPYWILGRTLSRHNEPDRAAIAFLHVPILYPQAQALAADALSAAARILDADAEKEGDSTAALRLRRELAANYPASNATKDAQSSLGRAELATGRPATLDDGENVEQAFLNGLRARRLFSLAERRCRQRLADTGLSEAARIATAIELSRTLTEHALNEAPGDRDRLWSEAVAAVRETGAQPPIKSPRRVLLDAQTAIVHLVHGELSRQEAELVGGDDTAFDTARQELRTAVGLLQDTSKTVAAELRRAMPSRRADRDDSLTENEAASLAQNLEYQLARAFRNQGQSYPPKSPDRTNSLRQAVDRLQSLTAADLDETIAWPARIDEVVCLRLLENLVTAAAKLQKFAEMDPPPPMLAALEAERIRLSLDRNDLGGALAAVEKVRNAGPVATADLDYACLEVFTAAWHRATEAGPSGDAARWQDRAGELVGEIDERFGRYWSRRAEMLLAGSVTRGGDTQNVAVLVRAAESLFRSGQLVQARQTYDRAAKQAGASNRAAAFDYAFTAAAIDQRLGHHNDAAQRFRSLALANDANEKAGDAHVLAIYNLALAVKQDAGDVSSQDYLALLDEHLKHWPHSDTADQVGIWKGELCEREQRWADAVEAYQAVRVDGSQAKGAVEGVARSYERWLGALTAAREPVGEVASQATRYLERIVVNSRGGLPERWSQVQRVAATSAARIWLQYGDLDFAKAERILSAALADASDAPDEWRATAQTLEVFAVAAQGKRDKAAKLLGDLAGGEPAQMIVLIEGLGKVADHAAPAVAGELADLQLTALQRIESRLKELPKGEQRNIQRAAVRALAAAKRHDEAIAAARKLADSFPRDGQLQEEYAQLLLDSPDRESWQAALAKWRDIGQKTRQGSERWLRSIYCQSLALVRLGEKQQAERLIKLAEAIVPELGGPEMKAKFRALAR